MSTSLTLTEDRISTEGVSFHSNFCVGAVHDGDETAPTQSNALPDKNGRSEEPDMKRETIIKRLQQFDLNILPPNHATAISAYLSGQKMGQIASSHGVTAQCINGIINSYISPSNASTLKDQIQRKQRTLSEVRAHKEKLERTITILHTKLMVCSSD